MSRLTRAGHGIESPGAFAAVRVIRINKAAHSIFATRDPDNDLVLDRERSDREDVSLAVVGRLNVPDNVSGFPVESDHVRIERSHKDLLTEHRETTIYHAAASLDFSPADGAGNAR